MKCYLRFKSNLLLPLIFGLLPSLAFGGLSVTLGWDAVTNVSPAGYKLYFGGASHVYTNSLNAGLVIQKTVSNLVSGATYYFAVTAYDSIGQESSFSTEIAYIVPPSNAPPAVIILQSPVSGATFVNPANIAAMATVVTNNHVVGKVEFFSGTNCFGQGLGTPFCLTWTNVSTGTYSIVARLTYDGSVTMDSAPAMVVVADARPAPPVIRLTRSTTNTSILSGTGSVGQVYEVQASQDLAQWSVLGSVTNNGSGSFVYADGASVSLPKRFYRLRVVGP
jgi:hypothetical protein